MLCVYPINRVFLAMVRGGRDPQMAHNSVPQLNYRQDRLVIYIHNCIHIYVNTNTHTKTCMYKCVSYWCKCVCCK